MASSGRNWKDEDIDLLIHLVQRYSCLYDTSNSNYKDSVVKGNAFLEIDVRMGRSKYSHK